MKIAIVGCRKVPDAKKAYDLIRRTIPRNCSEIVSGGAAGIDTLAELYASENKLHLTVFKPEFDKYGKFATKIRNTQIVAYADLIYAYWDMNSKGTAFTLKQCIEMGKPFKIFRL